MNTTADSGFIVKQLDAHFAMRIFMGLLVMVILSAAILVGGRFFGRFYGFVAGLCYVFFTANPFTCALIAESELIVMGFVLPGVWGVVHLNTCLGGGGIIYKSS